MNKTKLQEFIDTTKTALAKKDASITLLKTKLARANGEKVVSFKMPIEFPEVQIVEINKSVKIENLPEIQKVEVTNAKKVQDVNILNLKEIKAKVDFPKVQDVRVVEDENNTKSAWVPAIVQYAVKSVMDGVAGMLVKIMAQGMVVRLDAGERSKPMAVFLVGPDGRPINPQTGNKTIPMYFGNSGGVTKPPSLLTSGRVVVTTAGTPVALLTSRTCRRVVITAPSSNADAIYVGGQASAVAGAEQGLLLLPAGSATIEIDNANKIFADAVHSGDAVTFNIET